jgi:DNA-binding transcriptional ArsR family regulator
MDMNSKGPKVLTISQVTRESVKYCRGNQSKHMLTIVSANGDAGLGLLGDPTRRAIFEILGEGPSSVGELADRLPISRPAVSQHLRLLKDHGLVRSDAQGTRHIYRLDPGGVEGLLDYLGRAAFPWPPMRRRPWRRSTPMDDGIQLRPLRASVIVTAGQDAAFTTFTRRLGAWWPHQFHLGPVEPVVIGLEPRPGGRWYQRAADGTRQDWGRVLVWNAPRCFLVTWEVDNRWRHDPDPAHASELEVRFRPEREGDRSSPTVVSVEQRNFDRLAGGRDIRNALAAGDCWRVLLQRFARQAVTDARHHRTGS